MNTVEYIMSSPVISVAPQATMNDINRQFAKCRFHHLLVVENERLMGVLSDRDVARSLSPLIGTEQESGHDALLLEQTAADIMTSSVVTIDPTTTIECAAVLLIENNFSCLPVIDHKGSIAGILSWRDILRYHVYGVDQPLQDKPLLDVGDFSF